MKGPPLPACAAVVLLWMGQPLSASSQALEAARYVNKEGIEVIQGREAARPAAAVASLLSGAAAQLEKAADTVAGKDGDRFRISAARQRERDQERLAILHEEMAHETAALQAKAAILTSHERSPRLGEAELTRVREQVRAHEANVRALHAEIGRAQIQAGMQPSTPHLSDARH